MFYFESFERLHGDVRLTFGKPSRILRGAWVVSFQP